MAPEEPAKHVFVSHSHADNATARPLVVALRNAGYEVWYDESNMGAGNLADTIERELRAADVCVVILSPDAVASPWVKSEWYAAWELMRDPNQRLKTLVPVIAQSCDIPILLRGFFRIECASQPISAAAEQLIQALGGRRAVAKPEPTTWEEARVIPAHTVRGCFCLAWSPDGRWVASGSQDKTIKVWDTSNWTTARVLTGHTQGVDAVAWAPNSSTLASASFGSRIRLWNGLTGVALANLDGHTDGVTDVAWSPDGAQLASCSSDGTARVWDVVGARVVNIIQGQAQLTSVAWSPDGRWLATTGRDARVRIWNAATGAQERELIGHQNVSHCARWSPDGRTLASSGNTTVRLWNPTTGEELMVFKAGNGYVSRLAWRPNGSLIASCGADRTVRLWSVRERKSLANLGGHTDWVHGVAWSPGGQTLASCAGQLDGTIRLWEAE